MEKITAFLTRIGFPLRNKRWSWGASSPLGVLLTTWTDDLDASGRYVRVLGWRSPDNPSAGLSERSEHLRMMWSGGMAGYAVVAKAKNPKAQPREIESYDGQNVRAIVSLFAQPDGSVWAELGDEVSVGLLAKHAAHHRLIPADDPFPQRPRARIFKASTASYVAKLPAFRESLIAVARIRGKTITYAEARLPLGIRSLELRHVMDRIGHACVDAGEPILTSLIVNEKTRRCSPGFFSEFRRDEDSEREDCYAFWSPNGATAAALAGEGDSNARLGTRPVTDEQLRERAAKFALVAVRPEQAAFRRRVFLEHKGACAVTGCTVPAALDAAHLKGRHWRLGHNMASDGLLLRKDIHALYDAGLLTLDSNGGVSLAADAADHYRQYLPKP